MTPEFKPYPKTPRLHRDIVVTEKIDGTNACVIVTEPEPGDRWVYAASRNRIITPGKQTDNFGFAAWVAAHKHELAQLGVGYHYGEWYGRGIGRGYGLDVRRFALFNPDTKIVPICCTTVPVLIRANGEHLNLAVQQSLRLLHKHGSRVAGRFMRPEGIIVYHSASKQSYKVLLENDDTPKGATA